MKVSSLTRMQRVDEMKRRKRVTLPERSRLGGLDAWMRIKTEGSKVPVCHLLIQTSLHLGSLRILNSRKQRPSDANVLVYEAKEQSRSFLTLCLDAVDLTDSRPGILFTIRKDDKLEKAAQDGGRLTISSRSSAIRQLSTLKK